MTVTVLQGDAIERLRELPADSVHCCITSPPYFGLRDYGTANWDGGDPACKHKPPQDWLERNFNQHAAFEKNGGTATQAAAAAARWYPAKDRCRCGARRIDQQIGLEATPAEWVAKLVAVFGEVRRVLRDDGTLWVNCGDCYATGPGKGYSPNSPANLNGSKQSTNHGSKSGVPIPAGYKPGDRIMLATMLAEALRADGWFLRDAIVWQKKSPMPESVSGWRFERHRIRISHDEYEALQALPSSADGISAEDLRRVQETFRTSKNTSAPSNRKRSSFSETSGRKAEQDGGKTEGSRSLQEALPPEARTSGQREGALPTLENERTRTAMGSAEGPAAESAENDGCRSANRGGVDGHSYEGKGTLLLVSEESDTVNDGSCDPPIEGRAARQGEHRGGVQAMQFKEEQQNSNFVVIACPGCAKCSPNDGLVLRKGSWRHTNSYEMVFQFAKTAEYFGDGEAVREAHSDNTHARTLNGRLSGKQNEYALQPDNGGQSGLNAHQANPSGRNPRNVWTLGPDPLTDEHFAAFPREIPRRAILASTSAKGVCAECGAPYARVVERASENRSNAAKAGTLINGKGHVSSQVRNGHDIRNGPCSTSETLGWRATCGCDAGEPIPATILDCFAGSGTTGVVADELGRDAVVVELSSQYCDMIRRRVARAKARRALGRTENVTPLPGQLALFPSEQIAPDGADLPSTLPENDSCGTASPDCPEHAIVSIDRE